MQTNQDKLEVLTQMLLKKETLNYQDVEDLLGIIIFSVIDKMYRL